MAGYVRQSTADIIPTATVRAAPINAEYNALRDAFAASGGHKHDGTSGEGEYVPLIADLDALNKVVIDTTNNRVGVFVEVSAAAVEQIRIQDGVIVPVTDNDIDLGTSSLEFKDLYLDGTAYIDTLAVHESATITSNFSVNGNTTLGNAASDTVTFTADIASAMLPSADNTHDLGAVGSEWRNLYIDGTANIDALIADTATISAGTIDNTVIGGSTAVAGSFSTISSSGATTLASLTVSGATALNGGLTLDTNKFTVADTTGNTAIAGTLDVTGATTVADFTATGTTVLPATSFGDNNITNVGNIALDSITADGSSITITGNTTFADGAYDFDVASHDGSNGLKLAGTLVTSSAAELNKLDGATVTTTEINILDGDNSATSTTVADADRVVMNDNGTMVQVAVTDLAAYFDDEITAMPNLVTTAATTVGALNSGSITSGFGSIDTGSSTITTTGNITGGNIIISDGGNIGSASDTDAIAIASNGNVTLSQNLTVSGDLQVDGTTTTVNSNNLSVDDQLIELGNGRTGSATGDSGIVIERGSDANAFIGFDESADKFTVGTGTFTGTSTGDLSITTGTLVANIEGNVTGDLTGNADTATALETARTIAGQSFDGTANISIATTDLTSVTATAAEVNIMDGDTAATSTTLADADRVVVNDAGTMKQVALTDFETYFESALDTLSNVTTVGTLNSGSITSGFGSIDNGSSAITTTGTITFGTLSDGSDSVTNIVTSVGSGSANSELPTALAVENRIQAINSISNNVSGLNATGAELNAVADVSAITIDTSTAIANNDGIAVFDSSASAIGYFDVDLLDTYFAGTTKTLTNKTLTSPTVSGLYLSDAGFIVEGSSADGNESTVTFTNPTADRTITFPDATGTVALSGATQNVDFGTVTLDDTLNISGGSTTGFLQASGTSLQLGASTASNLIAYTNNAERMRISSGGDITFYDGANASFVYDASAGTTFNEAGADRDFRVESDSNTHMLFVDAGNNRVGINTSGPDAGLHVNDGPAMTGGWGRTLLIQDTYPSLVFNSNGVEWGAISYDHSSTQPMQFRAFATTSDANGTGSELLLTLGQQFVWNENSLDRDFRVESDGNANMLFVDALNNRVGIRENAPAAALHVNSSDSGNYASIIRHSAATNPNGLLVDYSGSGDTNTFAFLVRNTARDILDVRGTGSLFHKAYDGGAVVFNEGGNDADFRVESDNSSYMFFVDGGNDIVNIGTSSNYGAKLNILRSDNGTNLSLITTDADASTGPILELYRNSASPNDNDFLGKMAFYGENSAGEKYEYARMYAQISDATDATEDTNLIIENAVDGTMSERLGFYRTGTIINQDAKDLDLRVESENNANMLFVDASTDRVGIGTSSPATAMLHVANAVDTASWHDNNTIIYTLDGAITEAQSREMFRITAGSTRTACHVRITFSPRSSGGIGSMVGGYMDCSIWRADSGVSVKVERIQNNGAGSGSVSMMMPTVSGNTVTFGMDAGNNGTGSTYGVETRVELTSHSPTNWAVADQSAANATHSGTSVKGGFYIGGNDAQNIISYRYNGGNAIVINEDSQDADFRVESDGNANMLAVDAGNNVTSFGKFGGGSTSYGGYFSASGSGFFHQVLTNTTTDSTQANLYINRQSSEGQYLQLRQADVTKGLIGVETDTNSQSLYLGFGDTGLAFQNKTDNAITPMDTNTGVARDNAIDLGSSGARFDDIYATNGTIQTSDRNEKQDIAELSEAEQRVAVAAKSLMRKYRWKDAVAKKGDDARTHFGIIAQDLQAAFEAEGLDAHDYAMFTSNTEWKKEIEKSVVVGQDDDGNTITEMQMVMVGYNEPTEGATEHTRLGVRYPELFAFIISAI